MGSIAPPRKCGYSLPCERANRSNGRNANACCSRYPRGYVSVSPYPAGFFAGRYAVPKSQSQTASLVPKLLPPSVVDRVVPAVHLGAVDHATAAAGADVDVGVDPHAPDRADRALDQDHLAGAPSRIIAPNSIVWLIRISNECEREPAIQSTWRAE